MVTLDINGQHLYLDGWLKENLDVTKQMIKKDWDVVIAIDGIEGAGKSVLAGQCAFYCDPSYNISRCCFSPQQFKDAVLKAEKQQAVVYDESYSGLNSTRSMSEVNTSLNSMLTQIRQKNLFIFIVMPYFFDLGRYVAIARSRALIHIYTGKKMQRGYFSFYDSKKKKMLYIDGRKTYQYLKRPNFRGRFTKHNVLDDKEYREKKYTSFEDELTPVAPAHKKQIFQRNAMFKALRERGFQWVEMADMINKNCEFQITDESIRKIFPHIKEDIDPNLR